MDPYDSLYDYDVQIAIGPYEQLISGAEVRWSEQEDNTWPGTDPLAYFVPDRPVPRHRYSNAFASLLIADSSVQPLSDPAVVQVSSGR